MSGLLKTILTAALGLSISAPLYAADSPTNAPSNQTTPRDDNYKAAMKKCDSLPQTEQAKCIVNIRPTDASRSGSAVASSTDTNTVKAGAERDADYAAAVKECEGAADRQRCIDNAKDHFGRM